MGFVGKNILDYIFNRCLESIERVVVIDDLARYKDISRLDIIEHPRLVFLQKNLLDVTLEDYLTQYKIDVVIHLAARTNVIYSIENPEPVLNNNIVSTLRVLEACRQCRVNQFIFASTSAAEGKVDEDGNTRSYHPYGLSKKVDEMLIEMYSKLYGLNALILRFFNLYGPYQYQEDSSKNVISRLFYCYLTGEPFYIYGDGIQTRDFVYVDDLSRIIWQSVIRKKAPYLTLEVGKGYSHSINQLVDIFQKVVKVKLNIVEKEARACEIIHSSVKNKLLIGDLIPEIKLEDGLARMLHWINSRYRVTK